MFENFICTELDTGPRIELNFWFSLYEILSVLWYFSVFFLRVGESVRFSRLFAFVNTTAKPGPVRSVMQTYIFTWKMFRYCYKVAVSCLWAACSCQPYTDWTSVCMKIGYISNILSPLFEFPVKHVSNFNPLPSLWAQTKLTV